MKTLLQGLSLAHALVSAVSETVEYFDAQQDSTGAEPCGPDEGTASDAVCADRSYVDQDTWPQTGRTESPWEALERAREAEQRKLMEVESARHLRLHALQLAVGLAQRKGVTAVPADILPNAASFADFLIHGITPGAASTRPN